MTVPYLNDLSTATLKGLIKTIFRWKGSVYKLIWKEFLLYFGAFYTFQVIYQVLPIEWKAYYLFAMEYCQRFEGTIPVNLVVGFYISNVCERFFDQFYRLPWVSSISIPVATIVQGSDEYSRKVRRTMLRYCNLAFVITMTSISSPAKKRFPNHQYLHHLGLLQGNELELFASLKSGYIKYFMPITWSLNLAVKARQAGRIKDEKQFTELTENLVNHYYNMEYQLLYDFVQLPLVYTQAVTLCVYTFLFSCLFSRQDIDGRTLKVDVSFPFFTFLQFFFYVGWLKAAEEMLNPYGDDDSDFNPNNLIDYNINASHVVGDEQYFNIPPLEKDNFFDMDTVELPHTDGTYDKRKAEYMPGTPISLGAEENTISKDMDMFLPENPRKLFDMELQDSEFNLLRLKRKKQPIYVYKKEEKKENEEKIFKLFN